MRRLAPFLIPLLAAWLFQGCGSLALEMPQEFRGKKLKEDPPLGYQLGGDDLSAPPTPTPEIKQP